MRKYFVALGLWLAVWSLSGKEVKAAIKVTPTVIIPTITIEPTVKEVRDNIVETGSKDLNYRLETVLEKNKPGSWNGINSIRKLIEMAIDRGVTANTIVLLLLLPLMATMVSFLHYLVGLSGYGIFMPTMIAVVLLATGVLGGLALFALILAISLLSNLILRKFKLHFWPARSINLILISMGTFGLMLASTYLEIADISKISIFPILLMIMLSEEFVRTQLAKSQNEAKRLMFGTLLLSIIGAVTMSVRQVQETVLRYPELSLIVGLIINVTVGNYSGIRLTEIKRFRKAIREK